MARRPPLRATLRSPLVALALVCLVSLGLRVAWLGQPCRSPCRSATDRLLVFDETYYVNAARVIAGVRPPSGVPYAGAPLGDDPNAEHPQGAKLLVAGLIKLLGDGPLAWRLPSLVFGTLCQLGLYALLRARGAGAWTALGGAALMAADNLLLVHGRIFTLDIFVLAGMLWGGVAYARGRPLLAGALVGVAGCMKMVGPYALGIFALLELADWLIARRAQPGRAAARTDAGWRLARLAGAIGACAAVLIGLLAVLDRIAPPYDNAAGKPVRGGVFGHLGHMFSYAAHQTSPHGPQGIASYPWQWLWDFHPIVYLNIDPSSPSPGLQNIQPAVHFLGVISPPILIAGLIGLGLAAFALWRGAHGREPGGWAASGGGLVAESGLPGLALAWFLGAYLPFLALWLLDQRTSYLYYMVIVMPGLYAGALVAAAALRRARWRLAGWVWWAWAAAVVIALAIMYPFTPLP